MPDPVSEILTDLVEEPETASVPAFVPHPFDAAEVHPGSPIRLRSRQTSFDKIVGVGVQMKAQFFAERVFEPPPT